MDINKIDEKLNDLKTTKEKLKQQSREYEILGQYKGEDRMILAKELYEEVKSENDNSILIKSKIPQLDKLIGGFVPGQLVVVSAPTGMGKTTFCQTLTTKFLEQDIKSAWFSYEVGVQEFLDKFQEIPACYMPRQIKQNSVQWIETRIKESVAKYDTKVIFIDHLHYLLEMQKMAQAKSISLLIGMLMRELKRIAIENNIVIFLVSHMKKSVYSSEEDVPDINDLRDSSFVGQESDIVLFIFRMAWDNLDEETLRQYPRNDEFYSHLSVLKVAKNRRTGSLGGTKLIFENKKFEQLSLNKQDDVI